MKFTEKHATIIILSLMILLSTYKILFNPGIISYGENAGIYNDQLSRAFIYSWNEYTVLGIQNYNFFEEHYYPEFTFFGHLKHFVNPILQKIYLIIVIIIPFLSIKKLMSFYSKDKTRGLIAGIIYTINPFFIERMTGNWPFLVGYGLLPLFFYYFLKYQQKPRIFDLLKQAIIASIILELMPHAIALIALLLIIYIITRINKLNYKQLLKNFLILGTILLILNANMYLPSLLYPRDNIEESTSRGFFITREANKIENSIRLSVNEGQFIKLRESPMYNVGYIYIILSILSFKKLKKKDYFMFILLIIISIFFAKANNPPLSEINLSLENTPLGSIFRDTSKLLMITSLAYTILISNLNKKTLYVITAIFLIYNFNFFTGNFLDSIVLVQEQDYLNEINNQLIKDQRIIYLPINYTYNYDWYPNSTSPNAIQFPESTYMFKQNLANKQISQTNTYGKIITLYMNNNLKDEVNETLFKKTNTGYLVIDHHGFEKNPNKDYELIDLETDSEIIEFSNRIVNIFGNLNSFKVAPDTTLIFNEIISNETTLYNEDLDDIIIREFGPNILDNKELERYHPISDITNKGSLMNSKKLVRLDKNITLNIEEESYLLIRTYFSNKTGIISIDNKTIINTSSNINDFKVIKIKVEQSKINISSNELVILDQIKLFEIEDYEKNIENITQRLQECSFIHTPEYEPDNMPDKCYNNSLNEKQTNTEFELKFEKISPVLYKVNINSSGGYIIFKSNYDQYWKLGGIKPFRADYYANGYEIPSGDYELFLYYEPEFLYKLTLSLTIIGYIIISYLIIKNNKRYKK